MAKASADPVRIPSAGSKTVPQVQSDGARNLRKGEATRERILAIAEASVLAKGFGATSIDEIIAEAGLTKSGFFYHFRDKNELAREMLRRYIRNDEVVFDGAFGRGRELSDDPLQAFLIGLKLLADVMRDLPSGHPGCLVASVCYQERLFDREVCEINRRAVEGWNSRFLGYLRDIAATYPPRQPVRIEDLARMLSCMLEGAIIMGKVLSEPRELERQVLTYRTMVRLVFSPA
jgi:AcrR family transcriptional regulator